MFEETNSYWWLKLGEEPNSHPIIHSWALTSSTFHILYCTMYLYSVHCTVHTRDASKETAERHDVHSNSTTISKREKWFAAFAFATFGESDGVRSTIDYVNASKCARATQSIRFVDIVRSSSKFSSPRFRFTHSVVVASLAEDLSICSPIDNIDIWHVDIWSESHIREMNSNHCFLFEWPHLFVRPLLAERMCEATFRTHKYRM